MKRRVFLGAVAAAVIGAGADVLSSPAEAKDKVKRDASGRRYTCKWKKNGGKKWRKHKWVFTKSKICKWLDP